MNIAVRDFFAQPCCIDPHVCGNCTMSRRRPLGPFTIRRMRVTARLSARRSLKRRFATSTPALSNRVAHTLPPTRSIALARVRPIISQTCLNFGSLSRLAGRPDSFDLRPAPVSHAVPALASTNSRCDNARPGGHAPGVPLNTSTKSAPPPSAAVQANSCLLWTAGLRAFYSSSAKRPRRARDGQINRQRWQRWQTTGHRAGASTPACRPTLQAGTPGAACWRLDCSPALGACHHVDDGNRRWAALSSTSHSRAATALFNATCLAPPMC